MKKTLLVYLLISTTSILSFGQIDFRLNLDDLYYKKAALNIEMGYDKKSVELGSRILYGPWDPYGAIPRLGFVTSLRGNKYTSPKKTLDGFHVSGTIDHFRQVIKFDEYKNINNRFGLSALAGYKYRVRDSKLSLQFEGGVGFWVTDKTRFTNGLNPLDEIVIDDLNLNIDLGLFKNLRKFRTPVNFTINYAIGSLD